MLLLAFAFTSEVSAADPPERQDDGRVSVPVHYSDQAVVISTKDGVALVCFTDGIPEGRKYVYRFLSKEEPAEEQRGEGAVFEKYDRKPAQPPDGGVELTDAGGQLRVVAGKIALLWSLGGESKGWLYFVPEDQRVQFVKAGDFEKIKLARFVK
jgi:hypothetical protein